MIVVLLGRQHPPGAGKRIATPVCALARNDKRHLLSATKSVLRVTKLLSLRTSPQAGVAIRSPAMHSIASAEGRQHYQHKL